MTEARSTPALARQPTTEELLRAEQTLRAEAESRQLELERESAGWQRAAMVYRQCLDEMGQMLAENRKPISPEGREHLAAMISKSTYFANDAKVENLEDWVRNRRQARMLAWAIRTYGDGEDGELTKVVLSPDERAFRFFEEAVELVQAVLENHSPDRLDKGPLDRYRLENILARVLAKPPGRAVEEAGAVSLTLHMIAEVLDFPLVEAERQEFARVLRMTPEEGAARWKNKRDQGM